MRLQKLRSAWFTMEQDPDSARFEIKHLRAGEISRIVDETHKQRFEFRKDQETGDMIPVPVLEINTLEEKEMTIVEAVTDWENVFDENMAPLACTKLNRQRFCKELSEQDFAMFVSFVRESRQILADRIKAEAEETEKN